MDDMGLPLVDLHLLGSSDTNRGWWASRLHTNGQVKLYGGVCAGRNLEGALHIALSTTLTRLKRPCRVLVYAPPGMKCPEQHGAHALDHIATVSQGEVFDQLRRVGNLIEAVTPLPAGKDGLTHVLATCDGPRGAWLAVVIAGDGKFIQLTHGEAQTTPTRLALLALGEGIKLLPDPSGPLCFVSDSDYVLLGQEGMYKWPTNNWSTSLGKPLKNADLWQTIYAATRNRPVVWARMPEVQGERLHGYISREELRE